jgi:hypothetical protein
LTSLDPLKGKSLQETRGDSKHRFGALRFPVVIDLERESATYFAGKWGGGYIYREHVLSIVRKDIVQPLVETGLRTCPPH